MKQQNDIRTGLLLCLSLVFAILLVISMFHLSAKKRQLADDAHTRQLLETVLPIGYDNDPSNDVISISAEALGSADAQKVYRARQQNSPVGAVITTVAPDGYSGAIKLMVGFSYNGQIHAVRVMQHRETPGLGDDIDISRSNWIKSFDLINVEALSRQDWNVVKFGGQFDQFTGATITPQAVVHAVFRTASWYKENRHLLY